MGFDSILTKICGGNEDQEKPDVSHVVVAVDQYIIEKKAAQALAKMIKHLNVNGLDHAREYLDALLENAASGDEEFAILLRDRLNDCIERAEEGDVLGIELNMVDPSEGGPSITEFNELATEIRAMLGEGYSSFNRVLGMKTTQIQDEVKGAVDACEGDHGYPHAIISRGF